MVLFGATGQTPSACFKYRNNNYAPYARSKFTSDSEFPVEERNELLLVALNVDITFR